MLKKEIALICLIGIPLLGLAQVQTASQQSKQRDSIEAKIRLYENAKDTPNIIEYQVKKIEMFGLDTAGLARAFTNNIIFELFFMYSNDHSVLNKSLNWMKIIMDSEAPRANHFDTYANLLYKTGQKKQAIQWETMALTLAPDDLGIRETLEKMKNNIPTWFVNN